MSEDHISEPDHDAGPTGSSSGVSRLRVGLSIMVVGAALTAVGLVSTTSASVQPTCPEGSSIVAAFSVVDGVYAQTDPAEGESPVRVDDGTPTGGTWTSTSLVSAVVVKGGPGSVTTTVDPAQLAGAFDNSLLTPVDGVVPDISGVVFCGERPRAAVLDRSNEYSVTLAARTCPAYTDIIANRNRNNLQESLEDLGPNTNYEPGEVVNPAKESAPPQDRCAPLTGWDFQWGTGIVGKSPSTANLSTVTGQNAIATTVASVPELDAGGHDTGRTIDGAITYTLTPAQVDQSSRGSLWIQGGTKAAPLGDGTLSFGALRCATDNFNGDNVEFVRFPNGARHVFCFAYYVAQPPEPVSITVVKQLTDRSPGGTTFEFDGDTSFIPGGVFTLRPDKQGGSAKIEFIRAAEVTWTVSEAVPQGWTLESLECTAPASGRVAEIDGSQFSANLAEGDAIVCTFTNDQGPPPTTTTTTQPTTTTTEPTTTTTQPTTTTTEPTTTTTQPTTTTTEPTTTTQPTTTTTGPTTTEGPTTTAGPTTTGPTTTASDAEVEGEVIIRTQVRPDDSRASAAGLLAYTGGTPTIILVAGIVLLLAGATLVAVGWMRRRQDDEDGAIAS